MTTVSIIKYKTTLIKDALKQIDTTLIKDVF
jgi:hypothetical protein